MDRLDWLPGAQPGWLLVNADAGRRDPPRPGTAFAAFTAFRWVAREKCQATAL